MAEHTTHEEGVQEHTDHKLEAGKRVETVGRVLATIGLIILLVLGAWGIIILAFNAPDFFSRIGNDWNGLWGNGASTSATTTPQTPASAPESLSVSAAATTVVSGQTINLSWTDQNAAGARGFLISYACQAGLSMDTLLPDNTYRAVPCATPFNYTNAQSTLSLRVHLTGTTPQPAVITVAAISLQTGTTTASGSASVTVNPATAAKTTAPAKSTTATKPAVSSRTTYTSYRSNTGSPDLAVSVIAVGYINPANGAFTPLPSGYQYNYNNSYGTMAVEFNVQNVGSKTAPAGWQFTANLPGSAYSAPYQYTSQPQGALTPGSGIIFTLRWSNPNYQQNNCVYQTYPYGDYSQAYGNPTQYCAPTTSAPSYQPITITVDPAHVVPDYNWSNNVAQATY